MGKRRDSGRISDWRLMLGKLLPRFYRSSSKHKEKVASFADGPGFPKIGTWVSGGTSMILSWKSLLLCQ